MIHHSHTDYAVASSQAAAVGRRHMESLIVSGLAKTQSVVNKVLERVIQDRVVRTKAVKVVPSGEAWTINVNNGQFNAPLHPHALGQLLQDAEVPKLYADKLVAQANGTEWGKELVATNLNTIFAHRESQRNLVRQEESQVKGWLSDRFRRVDSRPLLDAYLGVTNHMGMAHLEGYALDTKVRIRSVLPIVFEPIKDEVMMFGLEWGNSDFGDGAHQLSVFMERIFCTNLALGDQVLRQIHRGARLADDIRYSEETYRLDTQTNISALADTVADAIGPARVEAMLDTIRQANESEIKGKDVAEVLKKHNGLSKAEIERAKAAFESPDVTNLPPGNTVWRLSNALSFIAQGKDVSEERKLELQAVAGDLVPHKKTKAKEV